MTPEEEAAEAGLQAFISLQETLETAQHQLTEGVTRQKFVTREIEDLLETAQRATQDAQKAADDLRKGQTRFLLSAGVIIALAGCLGAYGAGVWQEHHQEKGSRLYQAARALDEVGSLEKVTTCQISGFQVVHDVNNNPWCAISDPNGKTVGWRIP